MMTNYFKRPLNNIFNSQWGRGFLFIIGFFLAEYTFYFFKFDDLIKLTCEKIDSDFRKTAVWILVTSICFFHYLIVVLHKNGDSKFLIKTSNSFLDLVSTLTSFSIVLNSSLSLVSGILKAYFTGDKLFAITGEFDLVTIFTSSLFPIVWVSMQLYQLLLTAVRFEKITIKQPLVANESSEESALVKEN